MTSFSLADHFQIEKVQAFLAVYQYNIDTDLPTELVILQETILCNCCESRIMDGIIGFQCGHFECRHCAESHKRCIDKDCADWLGMESWQVVLEPHGRKSMSTIISLKNVVKLANLECAVKEFWSRQNLTIDLIVRSIIINFKF